MIFKHLYGYRGRPGRERETTRPERPRLLRARVAGRGTTGLPPYAGPTLLLAAAALLLAGLVTGARAAGRRLCGANPRFAIAEVVLPASLPMLSRELILEKAGVAPGTNLFARTPAQIRADLLTVPAIKSVAVTRRLPSRLEINIGVREPVARVGLVNGYSHIVDMDGLVFTRSARYQNLPLLDGVDTSGLEFGRSILNDSTRELFEVLRIIETKGWQDILPIRILSLLPPARRSSMPSGGTKAEIRRTAIEVSLMNVGAALQRDREHRVRKAVYTATENGSVIASP
jgi:POTRA domain, FtsQ-type